MAGVSAGPYFWPGHVKPSGQWVALPVGVGCPALLQQLLAVNELVVDESTSRDGNCGIRAFVISRLALLKGWATQEGHIRGGAQEAVLEAMPARAASDTGARFSNRVGGAPWGQIVGGHDCLWSDLCCDRRRLPKLCATDAEE